MVDQAMLCQMFLSLGEQLGIVDRNSELVGENLQNLNIIWCEVVRHG